MPVLYVLCYILINFYNNLDNTAKPGIKNLMY